MIELRLVYVMTDYFSV